MTQAQLLAYLATHHAWLTGAGGAPLTLAHVDLRGCSLRGLALPGASLSVSDLAGCDLTGADLRGVDFAGANLAGCILEVANIGGANFSGAILRGADMRNTTTGAGGIHGGLSVRLAGADMLGAQVDGMPFAGVDTRGVGLRAALLGPIQAKLYAGFSTTKPGKAAVATMAASIAAGTYYGSGTWLGAIGTDDTPATSQIAAITHDWLMAWQQANP